MIERDFIVALVAIGVGLVLIWNGLIRTSDFRSPILNNLESGLGKRGAKLALSALGVALVLAGIYLVIYTPSQETELDIGEARLTITQQPCHII